MCRVVRWDLSGHSTQSSRFVRWGLLDHSTQSYQSDLLDHYHLWLPWSPSSLFLQLDLWFRSSRFVRWGLSGRSIQSPRFVRWDLLDHSTQSYQSDQLARSSLWFQWCLLSLFPPLDLLDRSHQSYRWVLSHPSYRWVLLPWVQ